MSEVNRNVFEPDFNRSIKVEATNQRLTSNAGVLLLREADQRLQVISAIADEMCDPRDPSRIRYSLAELLRERVYTMALGFSAQDDVDCCATIRRFAWRFGIDEGIRSSRSDSPANRRNLVCCAS